MKVFSPMELIDCAPTLLFEGGQVGLTVLSGLILILLVILLNKHSRKTFKSM